MSRHLTDTPAGTRLSDKIFELQIQLIFLAASTRALSNECDDKARTNELDVSGIFYGLHQQLTALLQAANDADEAARKMVRE